MAFSAFCICSRYCFLFASCSGKSSNQYDYQDSTIEQAQAAYLQADYQQAVNILKNYLPRADQQKQAEINLWLGKTYLANEEPEIAREYFTKVLSGYSADYHQKEAREYLDK